MTPPFFPLNAEAQPTIPPLGRNEGLSGSLHRKSGNMKLFAALLGVPQVILGLLVEPALSRCAKRYGQANGHLGADTCTAVENSRQGLSADTQRLSLSAIM